MMRFISLLLILTGCASTQKRVDSALLGREWLFPNGLYSHQVEVEPEGRSAMSFRGMVRISPAKLIVIGLSPFQTTVFRITEERSTGEVKKEFYLAELQRREKEVDQFYRLLREFLTHPNLEEGKNRWRLKSEPDAEIVIQHFDENRIPDDIFIYHPKFKLRVKVTDYEI